MAQTIPGQAAISRHLWRLARPHWRRLAAILVLGLAAAPLSLLLAFPLKIAVDNVIGNQPLRLKFIPPRFLPPPPPAGMKSAYLFLSIGLLLTLSLLMNLQAFASWLLQTYTGEQMVLDLRSRLFWHAQRMDLLFHERRGTNDVAYRIQHDAPAIQNIFLQGAAPMAASALSFGALVYVTATLDWMLAAIALGISPVLFLLARKSSRRARQGWEGVKKLDSSAMLVLHEALSAIRLVKAFGQEHFEDDRFRLRSRQRMTEQVKVASTQALYHVLITSTIAVGSAAALLVGVHHVQTGAISLGELLLVMAYMAQLYEPLRTISGKLPELQSWLVSLRRALALLEAAPELMEAPHAIPVARTIGQVGFHEVGFEYPASGLVLNDISFTVAPGTRVGILGPSGSGKSTLASLLTRFYDPCRGSITLDGQDLRCYRLADLRRQFSIVLQDTVVFSATVAENIAYGRPQAGREAIIDAARAARAHDFILALPNGYDTPIGEGGCRLSGGERQRLAIARAFLKDAPVLIFDEPTSAIDLPTEREILEATEALIRGRTTFIIAHRLDMVKDCDLLLVLRQGRLQTITSDFGAAVRELEESHGADHPERELNLAR